MIALVIAIHEGWEKGQAPLKKKMLDYISIYINNNIIVLTDYTSSTCYLLLLYDLDPPSTSPLRVPCLAQYLTLVNNIFHIPISYHKGIKYLVAILVCINKNKNNYLNILSNLTLILLVYI